MANQNNNQGSNNSNNANTQNMSKPTGTSTNRTATNNPSTHENTANQVGHTSHTMELQVQDIKNLVKNQGRVKIGDAELSLYSPSHNDQNLQSIVNDAAFSVTPSRTETAQNDTGRRTYELRGNGKTVNVTVDWKNCC